jgi:hypothetical protein
MEFDEEIVDKYRVDNSFHNEVRIQETGKSSG